MSGEALAHPEDAPPHDKGAEHRADANAADAVQKEKRKYYRYGKAAEIKTGFDGFVGLIQYDGQFPGRDRWG